MFGYDAKANLVKRAEGLPDDLYRELAATAERQIATKARTRPANVKDGIVRERGYKTIRPKKEEVVEFDYRPGKCAKDYRVVALRKNLSIERGDNVLFEEHRFFFSAPRGALTYPPRSGEGLEVIIPGPDGLPGLERERGQ